MLIQNKTLCSKGKFYVEVDGNIAAELVYNLPSKDRMIIEHTEVDESLEGKGVGRQLVSAAVDYARTNQMKIIPYCPFAKKLFSITEEWKDVLAT